MKNYDHLKCHFSPYKMFNLSINPFNIVPLFKDFKEISTCEKEEGLFVYPHPTDEEAKILLSTLNQRILVYGLYGVGKTSFVDFILYLAHNFHSRFSTRVIISENNLEKAIQEILLSLCFDILSEIDRKKLFKPIEAIRKWIAGERYFDTLMRYIQQLMGKYTEISEERNKKKSGKNITGSLSLFSGQFSYEKETEVRKSLQSYVEGLPMRKVAEYLTDLLKIVRFLGFRDIIIYVDEADHLPKIESFLNLLTRSREVLFTQGYTFFVAGSVEIAKYTESMGAIFDELIFLKPATYLAMVEILNQRVERVNPKQKIADIFSEKALEEIFERSKGIRKEILRLAENSLKKAALDKENKVEVKHLKQVLQTGQDKVTTELTASQVKILKFLAKNDKTTPSEKHFQKSMDLSRTRIRNLLEELLNQGYVHKEKQGRNVVYRISSQYKAYFAT